MADTPKILTPVYCTSTCRSYNFFSQTCYELVIRMVPCATPLPRLYGSSCLFGKLVLKEGGKRKESGLEVLSEPKKTLYPLRRPKHE